MLDKCAANTAFGKNGFEHGQPRADAEQLLDRFQLAVDQVLSPAALDCTRPPHVLHRKVLLSDLAGLREVRLPLLLGVLCFVSHGQPEVDASRDDLGDLRRRSRVRGFRLYRDSGRGPRAVSGSGPLNRLRGLA